MSYRKILVPIFGTVHDQAALQAAFGLAKQFAAHAEALFVRVNPVTALPYGYLEGDVSGYSARYAIEAAIKAADAAQKIAQGAFDKMVDKLHIPVVAKPGARSEVTASFAVVEGDFADEIERRSRTSDLVVFGAASGDVEHTNIREGFESALLSGARPVLLVPRDTTDVPGQRVAIAYDGSATAAHAVTAALPFLARAKELHAFEVTAEKSTSLSDLQDYLSLRGLSATLHSIDPGPKATAEALLLAVQAKKCDLLVLGGYGHSRLGEFVFGGVTRHVLRHGAPLAVLMAH
jgi:nucleotide-binding universal stress UspA family protein